MSKKFTPLFVLTLALPFNKTNAANIFFADFESSVDQAAGSATAANLNAGTTGTGVAWVENSVLNSRVRSDGGGTGSRVFNPDNGA